VTRWQLSEDRRYRTAGVPTFPANFQRFGFSLLFFFWPQFRPLALKVSDFYYGKTFHFTVSVPKIILVSFQLPVRLQCFDAVG